MVNHFSKIIDLKGYTLFAKVTQTHNYTNIISNSEILIN